MFAGQVAVAAEHSVKRPGFGGKRLELLDDGHGSVQLSRNLGVTVSRLR